MVVVAGVVVIMGGHGGVVMDSDVAMTWAGDLEWVLG
jgi:hypothetical protein